MRSTSLLFLFLLSCSISAQQVNDTLYSIYYTSAYKVWEDSKKLVEDEKVLEICNHQSRFYATWQDRREEMIDSIVASGDDHSAIWQVAYPVPYSHYSVYKNYPFTGQLTYHDKHPQQFIYNEPLEEPVWVILPYDTIIACYSCQKAITYFRGRQWSVWYTREIPLSEGPWKLWGLPGLILQATDSKGDYSFTFTHLKAEADKSFKKPNQAKFKRVTRQVFNSHKIREGADPVKYSKELGKYYGPGYGLDGKPIVYKPRKPALLDY